MTQQPHPRLAPVIERLQRQDLAGARAAVSAALRDEPDAPALLEFGGYLAARTGDNAEAARCFGALLAQDGANATARRNFVTALAASGRIDEAMALIEGCDDPKLRRVAGFYHQQRGALEAAIEDYQAVVAADPRDFEIWNNLGNARMALGDFAGAAVALDRAIQLHGDIPAIYRNLSEAFANADQPGSRLRVMQEAARRWPADAEVATELGIAAAGARDFAAAESALRRAIALAPRDGAAYVELGVLLENHNRIADMEAVTAQAEAAPAPLAVRTYLRAWTLKRQARDAEALVLARTIGEEIAPLRRGQLLGDLYERLGDADNAFVAYRDMNEAARALVPAGEAETLRTRIVADTAKLPARALAPSAPNNEGAAPIFIVGFPRSGTTLLDTMLMNLSQLYVLEEQPIFAQTIGGTDADLDGIASEALAAMRRTYLDKVVARDAAAAGRIVVDKHPLQMTRLASIARVFPDARVILVERHPCDAVLGCYMANFQLSGAMRSFVDLEETARTYDAAFDYWTRATALFPLQRHALRYERLVREPEAELRRLLAFLEIDWDARVLDSRESALRRGEIRTASYAQVTEPIYVRAVDRWHRYRAQLAPVLPILAPWAERMGYVV